MLAAESTLLLGVNWYDLVVLVALLYGLWAGVRAGLSAELIGTLGLLLVVFVAPTGSGPVGAWLNAHTRLEPEQANLIAFISIAVLIYGITLLWRGYARRRQPQHPWPALIETAGGALAGLLRLGVFMACLTVLLCLLRSPFWHDQIARQSRSGAFIVEHVPALAATVAKQFPEKLWFLDNLHRPGDAPGEPN